MPLQAVVFDFDGVIANSEPLHLRAFQDVLARRDVVLTERDYYDRYLGFDDAGAFRAIGAASGAQWNATDIDALLAAKAVRMEELEHDGSILFPGAAHAIRRTAARVPIAIASGALGAEIRRILDREQLTACFAAIVSADDTHESKPAPEPYLLALARLSSSAAAPFAAHNCIAIEDSVWGLKSARAAGLRTVGVAQTYGAADLAIADLVIPSLQELPLDVFERLCS